MGRDYRVTSVNLTVVPGRRYDYNPQEFGGRMSVISDDLNGDQDRWRGRKTWLAVDDTKRGLHRTRVNVRFDRDQAVTLADAIIGPSDGTGLLTREQAVTRAAAMCQAWGITRQELEAEQVVQALSGF